MSQIEISNIEYLVVIGYLALIVSVGIVFKKFSKNTDDYFKGGSKGTWWLVGMSSFMSAFSAWTFTGAAGIAYESGFSVMFIFFGNVLGYFLNFVIVGPWLRQLRVTTFPEAINMRFGEHTQNFYAFYEVPIRILYSAMALYALAIFCSTALGYNIKHVIVVFGIIVLFYSATGGRWAVMATDFLQGLILIPLTIIIAWLCLDKLGGVGAMFDQIEAQGLKEEFSMINSAVLFGGAYTWGWASAMMTKQFIEFNSINAAPRYFSAKDGSEARKSALLASMMMLLGSAIWFIPPITARLLFPDQVAAFGLTKPAEASYAVASINLLPTGLIGLLIVGIVTATMSSMDTGLNTNVAILIKDIYPKLARRLKLAPKDETELLRYGRVLTWLMGILIILMALYLSGQEDRGIFEIMIDVGTLLSMPISIPLLWGMFIRRTPWWVALFSIGCALIYSAMAFFEVPLTYLGFSQAISDGFDWNFQQKFFGVFAVGSFSFLIAIFFAPAIESKHRKHVDKFFTIMTTPIDFAAEVGEANDDKQLTIIGRFGAAIAGFVALMLIIPNPIEGRLTIAALALIIGGISALMIRAGSKFRTT